MSTRSSLAVGSLLVIVPALAAPVAQEHPAPLYSIQDLGPIAIERAEAVPSISEVGAVALTKDDGAVLWDGVARTLDGLAGACDLDESGAVVGWTTEGGQRRAALWMNGVIVRVGPADALESVARAIDRSGRIAGTYRRSGDEAERSFLDDHGAVTDIAGLGGKDVVVDAMSDLGLVAGSARDAAGRRHAFRRSDGRSADLDPFPANASSESVVEAVNRDGVLVGSSSLGSASFGVTFDRGRAAELPRFPGTVTWPRDVDERGRVVGHSSSGGAQRAILIAGPRILDLETVFGPDGSDWRLLDATGINDAGEIVGVGEHGGALVAFLLRPLSGAGIVPEQPSRTPARAATRLAHRAVAATPMKERAQPPAPPSGGRVLTVSTLAGAWLVQGRDLTDWTATLVLDEVTHEGTFDWLSTEGYGGRELVTWTHDPATGKIHLSGHTMLNPVGPICLGHYDAQLADDGTHLTGTWYGPPGAPGTWTAHR